MNTESLALDFKSATLYAVRVVLHSADPARLAEALDKRMADAGSFFENEPVVIDASRVEEAIDWPALLAALRGHNLPPIGVVAEGDNLRGAREAGLASVELSTPPQRTPQADGGNGAPPPMPTQPAAALTTSTEPTEDSPSPAAAEAPAPAVADAGPDATSQAGAAATAAPGKPAPRKNGMPQGTPQPMPAREARQTTLAAAPTAGDPQSSSALVITKPLRSGQRVYARHTDLVVIGMVSQGAEVIADGNVHVYGPLRGKAMAGARGDTSARIFTTHLDAELLAVAGVYRVVEDKLDASLHGHPALVRLDGDTLRIEALKG
jgi:septum site-determining protein MinC